MESRKISLYQITPSELKELISDTLDKKLEQLQTTTSTKSEEDLMTVEETLKLLKCSKQALWNWRKNGILPSYRVGNRVYYKKSDIYDKLVKQS
ncbi:helix-turn-helix domain-containing protein [Psychroserpens sp. BH13MA-6]